MQHKRKHALEIKLYFAGSGKSEKEHIYTEEQTRKKYQGRTNERKNK